MWRHPKSIAAVIAASAGMVLATLGWPAAPAGAQAQPGPACSTPTAPNANATPPMAQATPPSPNIPAIQRLGLWNGNSFHSITQAGTIRQGHLYVLVHGWQAGMLNAVNSFPGPGPLLVWDPQAVTAQGTSDIDVFLAPMAKALTTLDHQAVVVAYSWVDDSATNTDITSAHYSESETVPNGQRLATVLNQAISPSFASHGGQVHIIGHSHGAKVATIAALGLKTKPRQLTLMDSPDIPIVTSVGAQNDLVPYLQQLKIGRSANQTFLDNYTSIFGCDYSQEPGLSKIVDVKLVPSQYAESDVQDKHLYPPRWYTAAAQDPKAGVGPEWSPLLGTKYRSLGLAYTQTHPGDLAQQLTLTELTGPNGTAVTK
jgi:hypothetical protein